MTLAGRLRSLLRVPLFSKILIANAVLVTLAAVAGALAGAGIAGGSEREALTMAVPVVLAAIVLTVLIDAVLLQLALEPLYGLQRAAERVRRGDLSARAPRSALADRDLSGLVDAFNDALERLAVYRRKLAESAARTVRREEAERDRISRVLQEESAQRLAALLVRLRIAAGERQRANGLEGLLEETRAEIAEALDVIREYAVDRRPRVLDDLGLEAALEALAHELQRRGLEVDVVGRDGDPERHPESERYLYRIAREALDNALRHSGARRATVRVSRSPGAIELAVEDDGGGFDVEAALTGPALGLFEMREWAAAVGGSCVFESGPEGGTRVLAVIPMDETLLA